MVNFCLTDKEKQILKSLIGKKLNIIRHDPLYKFNGAVYGRAELFFDDLIVLVEYDYDDYPIFGNKNYDDRPRFFIKIISEDEAVSALKNVTQVDIKINKTILGISLVEDYTEIEWENNFDTLKELKVIVFKYDSDSYIFEGDYMIPTISIFSGVNAVENIKEPGYEFTKYKDVKFKSSRDIINLWYLIFI